MRPTRHSTPPGSIAYAKERLASYKVPKSVEFVDAIPRTEAMKFNRAALVAERDGPDEGEGASGQT